MELKDRIRFYRKQADLSQKKLGKLVGVSASTVTQWEAGDTIPKPQRFAAIARALGISTDTLIGGDALAQQLPTEGQKLPLVTQPRVFDSSISTAREVPGTASMNRDVPIVGTTIGGGDGDFVLNGETSDYVRRPPGIRPTEKAFALYVQGDSMEPRYERGDLVYVNVTKPPVPGRDVIIEMIPVEGEPAGACYIKRLVAIRPDQLIVREYNPAVRDFPIDRAKVRHVWLVYTNAELLGA